MELPETGTDFVKRNNRISREILKLLADVNIGQSLILFSFYFLMELFLEEMYFFRNFILSLFTGVFVCHYSLPSPSVVGRSHSVSKSRM